MPIFGIDYSFSHPDISAMKSHDVEFVCRYIGSTDHTESRDTKWLNPVEYKSLKDAGLAVVVVFETSRTRAEGGRNAGITDAKRAIEELEYCGLPSTAVVYYAVDYDTIVGPHITGYFDGVASILGPHRVGVYSGYRVVKECFDKKLVSWGWQTHAWSDGNWDPRAHIQQYSISRRMGSGVVDFDRAAKSNYGQVDAHTATLQESGGAKKVATRSQLVSYMKSQVGTYGPPNNSNKFNKWYYERHVSGDDYSWCVVFACYCWNHFGILNANGGKFNYVPNFKEHFSKVGSYQGNPTSTKNFEPGDPIAYDLNGNGSGDHFGTVYKVLSSTTFQAVEGNTSGKGSDDVAIKTRSVHRVIGHAKLRGVDGSTEDDDFMVDYVSISKTGKGVKETLEGGEWKEIRFDANHSEGSKKHHATGDYPSVLLGPCHYVGTVSVRIRDLPKGTEGQLRCVYVDKDGDQKSRCDIQEFIGSAGDTFAKAPVSGFVPKDLKMRVEVVHFGDSNTKPTVISGAVRLHVKGA